MTATPGWRVVGFVGASATEPAFVLPVLRRDGGNALVLQRIDEHGRISEFEPLDDAAADTVTHVHSPFQRHIGDPPLWAFRLKPGDHLVAEKPELRVHLAERLDTPELKAAPLVRLRVIQFIGRNDLLVDALCDAYALMQTLPEGTARFWRDNVVLAPKVRERIAELNGNEIPDFSFKVTDGKAKISLPIDLLAVARNLARDRELATYMGAFDLELAVAGVTLAGLRPKTPWIAVTAVHARSMRAMRYLDKRHAGGSMQVVAFDDLVNGKEKEGLGRVYVFVDGTEGIDPTHLYRLRAALPSGLVHLVWADYGAQLPGTRHIDAAHALTLLPASSPWASGEEPAGSPDLSTSQRLTAFLKFMEVREHHVSPLSIFVAAYRKELLDDPRELANRLWVLAINPILPPWQASVLAYAGAEPDILYTLGRADFAYPPIPSDRGDVIAHLYEGGDGWTIEATPDLTAEGYMEAFRLMGWEVGGFRGDDGFMAESAATGRIQVLPQAGSFDRSNVRTRTAELRDRVSGPHVIIPTGPRPSADALALMCLTDLNVVLPHRLPLMAQPENEWAMLYPPLSQFNGAQLRRVLGSRLGPFLADHFPDVHGLASALRLDVTRATKSAGGASITVGLNVAERSRNGSTYRHEMTIILSPRGPVIRNEHLSVITGD